MQDANFRDALNTMFNEMGMIGGEKETQQAVAEVLKTQHRTIQQAFMRNVIMPAIEQLAQQHASRCYDLRNEASCELAAEIHATAKTAMLPFI